MTIDFYKEVAKKRTGSHEGKRKDERDAPIIHNTDLVGVVAEAELAKLLGLPFQGDVGTRGDPGYDFILPDGRTLDVKGTERVNGNLIVPAMERKPLVADLYALAIVDTNKGTAEFVGYATQEMVRQAPVKEFNNNYGSGYFVHRSKLRPMKELLS